MKDNILQRVYFPDFKGDMQGFRAMLPSEFSPVTDAQIINHMGHANSLQGVIRATDRSEALVHTGLKDRGGKYLFLRLVGNNMVCGKEYKYRGVINEDQVKGLKKYGSLPASPFANDCVDLSFLRKISRVEASEFHLFHDHGERWVGEWDADRVVEEAESALTRRSNSIRSYYTLRHGFQYLLPVKDGSVFLLGVWNEEPRTMAIVTKLTKGQADFDLMLGDAARAMAA